MRRLFSLFMVLAAAGVAAEPGCTTVTCGDGTIEKNGACAPADLATGSAGCGSGTVLIGDRCVSTVECDPSTTTPVMNPDGSITCKGNNETVPCGTPIACPTPSAGKQTICGQLYNIEDNSEFRATGSPTGARCTTPTADGPCSLRMDAYNAVDFAHDPMMAMANPLNVADKYIDECGRYKFVDITPPGVFVGLGFDDADASKMGPPGETNAVGVALPATPDSLTNNLEAFIAKKSTTDMWATNGPAVTTGFHVAIFRSHKCSADGVTCTDDRFAAASGVQIYKSTVAVPNNDYYFEATGSDRTTIDGAATSTGENGTGLLTGASVDDSLVWTGMGGLTDPTNCQWEKHAAASIPGVVTFQIYRPANIPGHTCNQ